jgi:hypothetical protein
MPPKKAGPPKRRKAGGKPKRADTATPTPVFNARPIYSERELRALSLAQEQARGNALEALSLMRSKGYSLTRAAREVEMTREAVRAWTGRSITKKGRRFVARGADKLVREMQVLTARGPQTVPIFDSRAASQLGAYHAAVKEALRGRPEALKTFRRKTLRTGGKKGFPLITDLRVLRRLAQAGALPEYQIYGLRAA